MTESPAPLAIAGGTPLRETPWPEPPRLTPATDGHPVEALEAAIAALLDLPASSVLAYENPGEAYASALGRPEGECDEAIVPALCAGLAAEAARGGGWRVVPGEVESDTGTLSPRGLTHATAPQTAIAVVAHAFGHPAMMTDLMRVAREQGLLLIEDITGALGATYRREPVGRLGHRAVMATRPGDPVPRGTYLIAPDPEQAARLRGERQAALNDGDARVALTEARALPAELEHRRHLAWELTFGLRGMRGVAPMAHGRWVQHAYAEYVLRLRSAVWKRPIADTVAALHAEGIPAAVASGPSLHFDARLRDALPGDPRFADDVFAAASRLPEELISIPLHAGLTSKDMDQVAAALRKLEAHST